MVAIGWSWSLYSMHVGVVATRRKGGVRGAHDGICTWQNWATGGREDTVGVEVKTGSETSQSRTEGKVMQSQGGARPRQKQRL